MSERSGKVFTAILAVSAASMAASVVYRSIVGATASTPTGLRARPDFIEFWQDALPHTIAIGGDSAAPLTVVVISDLECPGCRAFHFSLTHVLAERSQEIRALYLSFPLPYHRFAEPAARALECAEQIGNIRPLMDLIYEKQDSLGLKTWASFAAEAGIADTALIQRCATDRVRVPRIEEGRTFAERIKIEGTPTVIMNGWRYPYSPSKLDLDAAIDAVLAGKQPSGEMRVISEAARGYQD
jgi:hypothetical protein